MNEALGSMPSTTKMFELKKKKNRNGMGLRAHQKLQEKRSAHLET
jgi:hypothetical protein